jgi:aryl-alcohol dehydrogenase-like predicted oxidoreductase
MGVMVWGPLNSGWLTGKYRRGAAVPAGSRAERWGGRGPTRDAFDPGREEVDRRHDVVEALGALADEAGLPLAHLALAFTLEHPVVTSTIIGPRTPEQLEDLLGAADVRLEPDLLDRIDELVPPGTDVDPVVDAGWRPPWLVDASARRRRR